MSRRAETREKYKNLLTKQEELKNREYFRNRQHKVKTHASSKYTNSPKDQNNY